MNQKSPDNKKVLITALVSVAVIVLLGVTLYVGFSGKTAGRAIFTGGGATAAAGDAGFSGELSSLTTRNDFYLATGARLPAGKSSVAYSVEVLYEPAVVTFDPTFETEGVRAPQDGSWGNEFRRVTAQNGRVLFEFATLNIGEALSGDIEDIATFHFTVNGGVPLTEQQIAAGVIRFGEIKVLDLDAADPNTNLITGIKQPSAEIDNDDDDDEVLDNVDNCPLNANEDQADTDGDGVGDACEPAEQVCPEIVANDSVCGQFCRDNNDDYCVLDDADGLAWFNAETQGEKEALCAANGIEEGVCDKLSVDLNNDGVVGNDELFIIKLSLFAKDSEPQPGCGAQGQPFCLFQEQGYYICENLEYIQIINGNEQPAGGQVCGGIEHIIGGAE